MRYKESQIFTIFSPCTKNIELPEFERFITSPYVFMTVVKVCVIVRWDFLLSLSVPGFPASCSCSVHQNTSFRTGYPSSSCIMKVWEYLRPLLGNQNNFGFSFKISHLTSKVQSLSSHTYYISSLSHLWFMYGVKWSRHCVVLLSQVLLSQVE